MWEAAEAVGFFAILTLFVLAAGPEKAAPLSKILADAEPPDPPVARLLRQCKGQVTFFLDHAAAGK